MKTEFIDINEYVKYEDKDCLRFSDIHHLRLDGAFDYGKCIEWCNNDDNCGGFTLWYDACYFKSQACQDNIISIDNGDLYIRQGSSSCFSYFVLD